MRKLSVAVIAAAAMGLAACGGADDPAEPAAGAASTVAAAPAAAGGTISANTASEADLAEALTAAGVENAEKWAHEIEEYRPYPADDTGFAKLRKELGKYNPSPDQLEKIISVLTP